MKGRLQTTELKFMAVLVLLICGFIYFRYVVPYHVCFKEQIQMFMFSSSYLLSYFSKPAVFAYLGGDFLTQFLYFKTGGAVVITLILAAEWWLIFLILKHFSVKSGYRWVMSLLPVFVEWIFYPHITFSLALSVSFIISLFAFLIYTKTNGKISVTIGLVLIPILYVIAGASVFLFLFFVILYEICNKRKRFIYLVVISSLTITIPVILRYFYLLSLKQAYLYPYIDANQGYSLVVLALGVLLFVCFKKLKPEIPNRNSKVLNETKLKIRNLKPAVTYIVLASILITGLVITTDRKLENLLGIVIESQYKNWDKVLAIAENAELKNPIASYYTNLALSEKNMLGERLMEFYQPFSSGLLLPGTPTPNSSSLTFFSGSDAYFHIGDMEMAQHAAMLGMLSMPHQRSARLTERLAEINIAIGDIPAATKYIRMLESTLFHKFDTDKLKDKTHHKVYKKDIIRSADDYKKSLELLTESNPDNLPALNYLMCFYLLNKDIPAFFKVYTSYYKEKNDHVPKVYAEALLIYFAMTKASVKEFSEYNIQPKIIRSCDEYTRLFNESQGKIVPKLNKFSNTYWFYYHFAVLNK